MTVYGRPVLYGARTFYVFMGRNRTARARIGRRKIQPCVYTVRFGALISNLTRTLDCSPLSGVRHQRLCLHFGSHHGTPQLLLFRRTFFAQNIFCLMVSELLRVCDASFVLGYDCRYHSDPSYGIWLSHLRANCAPPEISTVSSI